MALGYNLINNLSFPECVDLFPVWDSTIYVSEFARPGVSEWRIRTVCHQQPHPPVSLPSRGEGAPDGGGLAETESPGSREEHPQAFGGTDCATCHTIGPYSVQ